MDFKLRFVVHDHVIYLEILTEDTGRRPCRAGISRMVDVVLDMGSYINRLVP